eukprot:10106004-Ditylum_brightwellii.AAC.1
MKAIQDTIYDEAEVCITPQLLTTIRKRKWLSDQPMVTLSTSGKGLSPFAVPKLTEDLIDEMNEQVKSLQAATSTTEKELCNILTINPIVEAYFSDFMLHLKWYVNLCYSLFGSTSPAYLQTYRAIKMLMTLKASAQTAICTMLL